MNRFLYTFLAISLLLSASIIFLNYRIDPFGAWRPHDKPLSPFSLGNISYARLAKALWIGHQQPDLAVLGNSHAASAFQAQQLREHLGANAPFNLALLGSSVPEIARNMRHAYYASNVRRFLVVIDLLNFQPASGERGDEFAVALARDDSLASRYFAWRNFSATTYSWAATARSLLVLQNGYLDTHTAAGFSKGCKAEIKGATLSRLIASATNRRDSVNANGYLARDNSAAWRALLGELMDFIAQEQLEVMFLIPPFHVAYYYALNSAGAWQNHQQMLQLLIEGRVEYGVEKHTQVIDFTGFNHYNGEFHSDKKTVVDYWQDADHFNCALANLLLARTAQLLTPRDQSLAEASPRLGARVTAENLAEHQRQLDSELQQWKKTNPEADFWLSTHL